RRNYDKAEKLLARAVKILRVVEVPPKYQRPDSLINAYEKLASLNLHKGSLEAAENFAVQVMKLDSADGHDSKYKRRERRMMDILVKIYTEQNKLDRAEGVLREKLAIELNAYGTKSDKIGEGNRAIGNICSKQGKNEEASECFEKAIANFKSKGNVNPI